MILTRIWQPGSLHDRILGVILWEQGKDTLRIAKALKMPEFQIYNELPKWKKEAKIAQTLRGGLDGGGKSPEGGG
jgi:hypothetical protein